MRHGPTYGVLILVTCKASDFLFQNEAGFARATAAYTRGLEPVVIMSPPYRQGLGACFQMAACTDYKAYLPGGKSQPVA